MPLAWCPEMAKIMPARRQRRTRFGHGSFSRVVSHQVWIQSHAAPTSADEVIEIYKEIFQSLNIPYMTLYTLLSFTIPKKTGGSYRTFEQKSILIPEVVEPPLRFEAYRLPPSKEGYCGAGTVNRPDRLQPPPGDEQEDEWKSEVSVAMSQGPGQRDNPFVYKRTKSTTRSVVNSSLKVKGKKRFKFLSDKNHDLSDGESSSAVSSVAPSSSVSSSGSSKPYADSEMGDSGQGSCKDAGLNSGDSSVGKESPILPYLIDKSGRRLRRPRTRTSESRWDTQPVNATSGENSSSIQQDQAKKLSRVKALAPPSTQVQPPPATRFEDDEAYSSDDQDVLIIGLTEEEANEFR